MMTDRDYLTVRKLLAALRRTEAMLQQSAHRSIRPEIPEVLRVVTEALQHAEREGLH